MIILGLDLSLSSTGWNLITHENTVLGYDKICTKSSKHTEFERIQIIANEVKEIIEINSVDVVVIEDQYFSKNPKTGLTLSKLMGAIIYVCMESEVKIELLTPTQARKLLSGDGRLKKEQIANFVRENYIDLGEFSDKAGKGKNSDLYDSLVVSLAWNKQNNLNEKWNK